MEEFAAKETTEDADWQEEATTTVNPLRAAGSDPPAWDNAVNMRMVFERLAPSVEDSKKPNVSTEVLRISSYLEDGLRRSAKKDFIDFLLILKRDCRNLLGYGKDDVKVFDGQEITLSVGEPFSPRSLLAFWTVTVPARVIGNDGMAASIALFNMTTKRGGATRCYRLQNPSFGTRNPAIPRSDEVSLMRANDVGHLQRGPGHGL